MSWQPGGGGYRCAGCGQWVPTGTFHQCYSPAWPGTTLPPVPARPGWECPKCGSVMAPWFPYCSTCRDRALRSEAEGAQAQDSVAPETREETEA